MIDIKIDKFRGPLGLLLQIIENEELDITEVSLARIADQYVKYIRSSNDIDPDKMADFLVLAAKLLLIKSKALLPYLYPEEEEEIREIADDPMVFTKLLRSIAPSIYGNDYIKEAVLYLLIGGVAKQLEDVRIKGDINVLLVGDPGTAKSQMLNYAAKVAPRGMMTTGRGSSAAGLTAAVVKEGGTGSFVLEAGALVLSDKGICCIDEMDKMREEDRGRHTPGNGAADRTHRQGRYCSHAQCEMCYSCSREPGVGKV